MPRNPKGIGHKVVKTRFRRSVFCVKVVFLLENLDNKVPNRVKSTQLWIFCDFFQKVLTFPRVCARQGDLFPTSLVGIKRKRKPHLPGGVFIQLCYFIVKCANSICAHSISTCSLSVSPLA